MAKRSQKRLVHHERGQSGCMSGFIGMFDFRQGRTTQKLLSDKKHGSSRHASGSAPARSKHKDLSRSKKHEESDPDVDNVSDGDGAETLKIDISKTSVKKLIEEDMCTEQQTEKKLHNPATELRSDPDNKRNTAKNHKQTKKTRKVACDKHIQHSRNSSTTESQELYSAEKLSLLDITSLVEEFCSHIQQHQEIHLLDEIDIDLVQNHSVLQEKLSEAAESFLNQKLVDAKQLNEDGSPRQSKQFIDALEILNSNKELLLKLLLQDVPSEKVEQDQAKLSEGGGKDVQKHNIQNFFRKRDKSHRRSSSEDGDSNRIVVLKPKATGISNSVTATSPNSSSQSHYGSRNHGWGGKLHAQFSLGEIKRRLKNTMGENRKEQHRISMDGLLHKVPNTHQVSENNGKVDPKPSSDAEREGKVETAPEVTSTSAASSEDLTMSTAGKQRPSNIYIEAKKHLEEILTNCDEDGGFFPYQRSPKTLGRILSLPDYASSTPLCSPGRDGEHGFVTAQMRFSPNGSFRIVNENIWRFRPENNGSRLSPTRMTLEIRQDVVDSSNSDIELQETDSNPDSPERLLPDDEVHESICSSKDDSIPKGDAEEIVEEDVETSIEEDDASDAAIITTGTTKMWEEEESSECTIEVSPQNNRPPSPLLSSFSSSSLLLQKVESLENINDPPEGPSPVSVLESFFDDINSPTTTTPHAELEIRQPHFHIEDDGCSTMVVTTPELHNHPRPCIEDRIPPLEYVTAVLQASNVNWDDLHSSELLLNPSLFNEVEFVSSQHCTDQKLLFDCINEVLAELYERYFGSSPLVTFVNPDIRPAPMGKGIIQEVWEGINWNLLPQFMQRSLDQIIGKDMEKSRTWMDLRSDAEVIGDEIVEAVLEDLTEDALIDLCS